MGEVTDNELLNRMKKGDTGALGVLYVRYAPSVTQFALRFIHVREEVDDLTHNIFIKLWEHREDLTDVNSLKGYLFNMTKNSIFKIFRHRQVVKDWENSERNKNENEISDGESVVTTEDLIQMIDLLISRMPDLQRKIFCMSRYENMTYNEIGEKLGVSPKTVQRYIGLALSEIRKLMNVMLFFTALDVIVK